MQREECSADHDFLLGIQAQAAAPRLPTPKIRSRSPT